MAKQLSSEELERLCRKTLREVVKDLSTSKHPDAPGAVAMGRRLIAESKASSKGGQR